LHAELLAEINARIEKADAAYGPTFASTHEALGVASEEWDELREAIKTNLLRSVEQECLDLAAVLIRCARMLRNAGYQHARSVKPSPEVDAELQFT
jgi:NTP pyrophosphatase (non-canonical NTP hydrolase)